MRSTTRRWPPGSALEALGRRAGADVDARRFRPNLVLDAPGTEEFPEDGWVGRLLRIGTAVVRVDKSDERCAVVNLDPDTLARSSEVLRTIVRQRAMCFGVYGSTVTPGVLRPGDRVMLVLGISRLKQDRVAARLTATRAPET